MTNEEFLCQCTIGDWMVPHGPYPPCGERMTQEDGLCDQCRVEAHGHVSKHGALFSTPIPITYLRSGSKLRSWRASD